MDLNIFMADKSKNMKFTKASFSMVDAKEKVFVIPLILKRREFLMSI